MVYASFFYEVMRVSIHLNASFKRKKTFLSVFILQTKNEEKKALDKELEWAVN